MQKPKIEAGVYRHFKGNYYEVIDVAPLVDSSDFFVVYRPLYGDQSLVLRLYTDFSSTVIHNGREEPRFQKVEAEALRASSPVPVMGWSSIHGNGPRCPAE
jgi:hypothetical protein